MRTFILFVLVGAAAAGCSLLVGDDFSGATPATPDAGADTSPSVIDSGGEAETSVPDAAAVAVRPPEGIYAYTAAGNDWISVGPTSAAYGPTASVTITHSGPECYSLALTLRAQYTETISLCVRNHEVIRSGAKRSQRFEILGGVVVNTEMTCAPGDVIDSVTAPPATLVHLCTGKNVESQNGESPFSSGGPYQFVGVENVTIAGALVPVRHFKETLTVTGEQTGTNVVDFYFAVDNGVLVRFTRKVKIRFPRAFDTDYTEDADLTLVSLTPAALDPDGGK